MTIIVEDGSIVENANSYVTTTELSTYATARGITVTSENREQYLIQAMDYFESLKFKGIKVDDDQSLQFPRNYLYIDNVLIDNDIIHTLVKESQMEIAIAIFQGYSPLSIVERAVKRERVYGAVEVEYMDNASSAARVKTIDIKLNKLLLSTSNGIFFRVDRV
jgi:hypothetical protein